MHRDRPRLEKNELLERLAGGHRTRIAVVTPNRRLAAALSSEFAQFQAARGRAAWETADILPFGGLVARLCEDALYGDLASGMPVPLSEAQEQALWEEAIQATRHAQALISTGPVAVRCRESWRLAQAWRISLAPSALHDEDARAFIDWASRYERATRERMQTDAARLPDVIAPHLGHASLRKPATLVLFGFDIVTPQMAELLSALAAQGCEVIEAAAPMRPAEAKRVELTDTKGEIEAAARWARSRLEQASSGAGKPPRIGVVVPDLAACRARVRRVFANVLRPDHLVADAASAMPFDVSLGVALAEYPLVADALLVIDLAGHESAFESASRLIRSPFLAGAETELEPRARLDVRLRERCGPSVTLESLLRFAKSASAPRAPLLVERLERLAEFRKSGLFGAKSAPEWAKAFSEALRIAGFPGERGLDSAEHQALGRWHDLVVELATLDRVVGRFGFNVARERLRGMALEALFQPEAIDVPIEVMGVLESAGQEFDNLWVMGLTDEAWPVPAHPDPFIPVRLQRAAGIPQSDPVTSLELDRRITQGWLTCAGEVVLSHPRMRKESELAPSPLISAVALASVEDLGIEVRATLRDAIRAAGIVEKCDDPRAPPVEAATRSGGTGLFKDQAACPFRAFAKRRVGAEPIEVPRAGLDARDRGNLVHEMMRAVWDSLRTHDRLRAASSEGLAAILEACADEAVERMRKRRAEALSGRYAALERARLVRLALEWLEVDRRREAFEVIAVEEKHPVTFGGITVEAKLDRMDQVTQGRVVIDYKTGLCKTAEWMGKRPDEPQIPMYALARGEDIAAVAFAVVKTGASRFRGISRVPKVLPDVRAVDKDPVSKRLYGSWDALLAGWHAELDATGRGFAQGDARVDPKRGGKTCENCRQQMFCRIAEKLPLGAAEEADPDE